MLRDEAGEDPQDLSRHEVRLVPLKVSHCRARKDCRSQDWKLGSKCVAVTRTPGLAVLVEGG